MGCDIHAYVENKVEHCSWNLCGKAFVHTRSYGLFGFLANVRNYSHVPTIAEPRGLPKEMDGDVITICEANADDAYSHSWLTLKELLEYNYDQVFWNRRVTKQTPGGVWDGASLADEGEGEHPTIREFLGQWYFDELNRLRFFGEPENVRLVFFFDS